MKEMVLPTLGLVAVAAMTVAFAESPRAVAGGVPTLADLKLPADWAEHLTVEDLTAEISDSATRMAQNLKKAGDFDKFLKNINAEGHLAAVLASLLVEHPQAGDWKGTAAEVREQALEVAKAAEAKGAKNYRLAQAAHKKITDLVKSGGKGGSGGSSDPTEWTALADLSHVMKRVDPAYKFIRGKVSDEASFKKNAEAIRHQAAVLAVLSDISPAYRDDDKDFAKLSASMAAAARSAAKAAKSGDFDKAKEANTAINATCNDCHKKFRLDQKTSDF
jgi:cytochrome c556